MKPEFTEIGTQEKGEGDWRTFLYFNYDGKPEEIRGYGETAKESIADAWGKFHDPEYLLYIYGIECDESDY